MLIFSRYYKKFLNTGTPPTQKLVHGFTLIEMMLVLGIIGVITALLIFNNSRFNSAILLRSFAYQIGASIREAQLYGVGVKETTVGSNNFSAAYGIYIPTPPTTSYILFADTNPNDTRDASDVDVKSYLAGHGFFIKDFCATNTLGVTYCSPTQIVKLAIVFRRPDPNAIITTDLVGDTFVSATITVQSTGGSTRTITVTNTGQIAVTGTAS